MQNRDPRDPSGRTPSATPADRAHPVEVLRFALGGATDAATRAIQRRIDAGDEKLAREVAGLALTAKVVREDARAGPSEAAMERLLDTVRAHQPPVAVFTDPPAAVSAEQWLQATPVPMPAGVRGSLHADRVLHCDTPAFRLTASLSSSSIDRGRAVDGQLVDDAGRAAANVSIAWLVDGEEIARALTDDLGEFSFPLARGTEFALRVEGTHGPRFINLLRDDES